MEERWSRTFHHGSHGFCQTSKEGGSWKHTDFFGRTGAETAAEGGEEEVELRRKGAVGQKAGRPRRGGETVEIGLSEKTGLSLSTDTTSEPLPSWRQKNLSSCSRTK